MDLTGQTFGRLTVKVRDPRPGPVRWLCVCSCGNERSMQSNHLRSAKYISCGCWRREPRVVVVDYQLAHWRLRKARGQASQHACADCGQQAAEWSYDGLDPDEMLDLRRNRYLIRYSTDPKHYDPRCRPCHRAKDRGEPLKMAA